MKRHSAWTCPCGALNEAKDPTCANCRNSRGTGPAGGPLRCPYDGGSLSEDDTGWYCELGRGYPYALHNPAYDPRSTDRETLTRHIPQRRKTACDVCRERLEWHGGCYRCHGTLSGRREEWRFPGDRYDRFDEQGLALGDGHHWQLVSGPGPACQAEDNAIGMRAVKRILGWAPLSVDLSR